MTKQDTKNQDLDSRWIQELLKKVPASEMFGKEGYFNTLKQRIVSEMLKGEMNHHLGYSEHSREEKPTPNRRNGSYTKKILSDGESLEIEMPRDRDATFEPEILPKGVRRFDGFDENVISLYARGMTVREIQEHLFELYGTTVSHDLISQVTHKVMEEVNQWTMRPLDAVYPVVFLDCLFVKAREAHTIINKAVYLAVGINQEGHKEILGLWLAKTEGAKFWMQVVTELKNRGVQDILIACVDGLKGFDQAIGAVFPQTTIQTCIVHMVRNSLKFVSWKDRKAIATDLKAIYMASTQEDAEEALKAFQAAWDDKYPTISDQWIQAWDRVIPQIAYPKDIRKVVYTTNTIESINRQIRKIIKNKGVFPHDDAIKKSIYLALKNASKRWTMPIRNWTQALNQMVVLFPDRITLFTQNS